MTNYDLKNTRISLAILVLIITYTGGGVYWMSRWMSGIEGRLSQLEFMEASSRSQEERLIRIEEKLILFIDKLGNLEDKLDVGARKAR